MWGRLGGGGSRPLRTWLCVLLLSWWWERGQLVLSEAHRVPGFPGWGGPLSTFLTLVHLRSLLPTCAGETVPKRPAPRALPLLGDLAVPDVRMERRHPSVAAPMIPGLCPSVCLLSRAARAGPSDVHHPQAGGPLLPWAQGGQRDRCALSLRSPARPRFLHGGHSAGAAQPGVGRGVCHP